MLKRVSFFVYGCLSYLLFLGTFLYAIGFVGNFLVPTTLDGVPAGSLGVSLAVDLALLTIFAAQHSVMARRGFKAWWTRMVPREIERSTYVLCASAALLLLFAQWRSLGGSIWHIDSGAGRFLLRAVCAGGWTLVLVATFLINHFDLFGLRQVWFALRGKPYVPVTLSTPWIYRVVRHPLYLGFLFAFWATPTMTWTHLVFAAATTGYILIAIQLEERDLIAEHGVKYATYRYNVPMLVPSVRTKGATVTAVSAVRPATKYLLLLIVPYMMLLGLESVSVSAQARHPSPDQVPAVPGDLVVGDGFSLFFKAHAVGTQNYMCLPSAPTFAWKAIGPQATLFHTAHGEPRQQVATHFLSMNPDESLLARPTWEHSGDSSRVWGKLYKFSSDAAYVDPNAIPWLLLERAGSEPGPSGGLFLTEARYIQRINTSGGLAPSTGCTVAGEVGSMVFIPYEADYYFYRARRPR